LLLILSIGIKGQSKNAEKKKKREEKKKKEKKKKKKEKEKRNNLKNDVIADKWPIVHVFCELRT